MGGPPSSSSASRVTDARGSQKSIRATMAAGYWSNRLGPPVIHRGSGPLWPHAGTYTTRHEGHCRIEQVDNKSLGHLSALGRSSPGGEKLRRMAFRYAVRHFVRTLHWDGCFRQNAAPRPTSKRCSHTIVDSDQRVFLRSAIAAAVHSITSSARRSSDVGNSMPIAFAVLRLTTSSYLTGCSTGRSPGWAPLRIFATKWATRR